VEEGQLVLSPFRPAGMVVSST